MGSTEEKVMKEKDQGEPTSENAESAAHNLAQKAKIIINTDEFQGARKKMIDPPPTPVDWSEMAAASLREISTEGMMPPDCFSAPYYNPQMGQHDQLTWGQATYAPTGIGANQYYYQPGHPYQFPMYPNSAGPSHGGYRPPAPYTKMSHPLHKPSKWHPPSERKADKNKKFDKPGPKIGEKHPIPCKYYEKSGFCENGCLCPFSHDLSSPMTQQSLKLNLDFLIGQQKLIVKNLDSLDKKITKAFKKQSEIVESIQDLDERFRDIGLSKTNMTKRDNKEMFKGKEKRERSRSVSGGERIKINDRLNRLEKRQRD